MKNLLPHLSNRVFIRFAAICLIAVFTYACSESPIKVSESMSSDTVVSGSTEGFAPETGLTPSYGLAPEISIQSSLNGNALVLPDAMASVMGDRYNFIPHANPQIRYQQVFSGSEVGGSQIITGFCLRSDNLRTSDRLVQQLTVKLGPTNFNPATIGSVFDNNYSAPPTTVFSGDFIMPETGRGDLNSWDACLDFTTPYSHPGGSLIVEMINTSEAPIFVRNAWEADFCMTQPGCNTTRLWVFGPERKVASRIRRDQGLIFRFETTANPASLTPQQQLQVEIQRLANEGVLNRGLKEALLRKVRNIQRLSEQGRIDAALSQVDALIEQVKGLFTAGRLTPAQSDSLTSLAVKVRVAIDPSLRSIAYVANWNGTDNSVSVIDVATEVVTNTITVGKNPRSIAFIPNGTRALVANQGSAVSVIDVASATVANTIEISSGGPLSVAIASNGSSAYIGTNQGLISVIDLVSETVRSVISVGGVIIDIAITPDGSTIYAVDSMNNRVAVIDIATQSVTKMISVGSRPQGGVAFTPNGRTAYVSNFGDNTVSLIDVTTGNVTRTISVGPGPSDVAVTPDGSKAYVVESGGSVSIIDVVTKSIIGKIPVGNRPSSVAFNKFGTTAYVTQGLLDGKVVVIDVETATVTNTISVGAVPLDVEFSPL